MTTTGPLELSGFVAGVSDEGPIASDSVRLKPAGPLVCDVNSCVDALSGAVLDGACAGWFATGDSVAEAGKVLISTGLDGNASWPLPGRDPAWCKASWVGEPVEACSDADVAMGTSGKHSGGATAALRSETEAEKRACAESRSRKAIRTIPDEAV